MNMPGREAGNWSWRFTEKMLTQPLLDGLAELRRFTGADRSFQRPATRTDRFRGAAQSAARVAHRQRVHRQPQRRVRETILLCSPSLPRIDQHHALRSQRCAVRQHLVQVRRLAGFRPALPLRIHDQQRPALAVDVQIGTHRHVRLIGDGLIDRLRRLHRDAMVAGCARTLRRLRRV